ncbi:hypothetical protein ACYSNX_08420 [Myroides sp. LJL115]
MINIKEVSPKYLDGKLKHIQIDKVDYFTSNKQWFESLGYKGKLVVGKIDKFKILHSGVFDLKDGGIFTQEDEPLLIVGVYGKDQKQCVIFDQRIHGFTSFEQDIEYSKLPNLKEYNYNNYHSEYEVFIYGNSSVDFECEFSKNEEGLIQIKDSFFELEYLKANAFDFIGILLVNKKQEIQLLELELV